MQVRRRGRAATRVIAVFLSAAAGGCAHHRADQYSYAPPYAPPVYPQPQTATQPVAYAGPAGAVPAAVVGPQPMVTAAPQGEVVVAAGSPCPPCGAEGMVAGGMVVDGGGQTPPCPPGP